MKKNQNKSEISIFRVLTLALLSLAFCSWASYATTSTNQSRSIVIEIYSGSGQVDYRYSMSMRKDLWDLKKERGAEKAETRLTANTAFAVQSRIFDLSMRDPKKGQECKPVAKIKTSVGDSLLCQEDSRSMGKLHTLITDLNRILSRR